MPTQTRNIAPIYLCFKSIDLKLTGYPITDKRLLSCMGDTIQSSSANIVSATDYSPFGAPLAGRVFSANEYRFGFNGNEKDYETYGEGNAYDFGARTYDPRLGRFFSIDPKYKEYPYWSPYAFAGNNPVTCIDAFGEGPVPAHHEFLTTVALDVYDYAKAQGASTKGALLVLAQASLESGWGASAIKYKDFNLFGVMGKPSKRSTSHGSVKDYSNSGGYKGALKDYFAKIDKTWPGFKGVLEKDDISADDVDKALNTGKYIPTKAERNKGNYAYNFDMDAEGDNHYGESLLKQVATIKTRLIKSIDYQMKQNEDQIKSINSQLNSLVITEEFKTQLTQKKEALTQSNTKLATIKQEVTDVK
jgi:RHS repeat-associated protein